MRRHHAPLFAAVLALLVLCVTAPQLSAQGSTLYFVPTDDTWVSEASPNSNYGLSSQLHVRGVGSGDGRHVYLKFSVSGLSGSPSQAILQLASTTTSGTCGVYWMQSNAWSETTLTWNNASTSIRSGFTASCTPGAGSRVNFDVSSMVSGNGTYTFGIGGPDLSGMYFFSAETTPPPIIPDKRPMLIVTP